MSGLCAGAGNGSALTVRVAPFPAGSCGPGQFGEQHPTGRAQVGSVRLRAYAQGRCLAMIIKRLSSLPGGCRA
jgi:hypothetical protein